MGKLQLITYSAKAALIGKLKPIHHKGIIAAVTDKGDGGINAIDRGGIGYAG